MKNLTTTIAAFAMLAAGGAQAQIRDLAASPLPPIRDQQTTAIEGNFPSLTQPHEIPGGHIQGAWDRAAKGAGVLTRDYDPEDTIRAALRSRMVTTIVLPSNDTVDDFALGDQVNFGVKKVASAPAKLWVWVKNPGYDTNLNIVGKTGAVYTLYLRGLAWNAGEITQQVISVRSTAPALTEDDVPPAARPKSLDQQKAATDLAASMPDVPPEWLQRGCAFDPTLIRHDRIMKGEADIAPVYVFRDRCRTFLDWGSDHDGKKWPAVFKVEDGVDKQATYDVSRDGRFQIIYSTAPLTLVSGNRFACIKPADEK